MAGKASQRQRMPSIRDVARLANVSHQTVSRVLNDHASIREETRSRVLEAIRVLDYRPNQAARALATSRLDRIGILSATVGEYGTTSAIVAIEEAARRRGFSVSTLNIADTTPESIGTAVRQLKREQVDGIIVLAPQVRVFNVVGAMAIDLPFVSLQSVASGPTDGTGLDRIDLAGARIAVEHLISLGHEDILHIAGPQDWIEADTRMRGYLDALLAADLPTMPPIRGDWTADFGHFAGVELARRRDFTAVFAANDLMAIGLMHGLRDAGLDVPGDVSVIGFDDIPVAAHVWPTLTTIHVDFAELGTRALSRLLAQMGRGDGELDVQLAPTLVARDSTAAVANR